jgi:hypothetical protein
LDQRLAELEWVPRLRALVLQARPVQGDRRYIYVRAIG